MKIEKGFVKLEHFVFTGKFYETRVEIHESFTSVWSKITQLWESHHREHPDVGISIVLENWRGSRLQVGVSDRGWFLLMLIPTGVQLIFKIDKKKGNLQEDDGESIPFLLPEWTEFEACHLHREDSIKREVNNWVQTNEMNLFIL
jgi:hypothetical protein